jgi:hypothetical protein
VQVQDTEKEDEVGRKEHVEKEGCDKKKNKDFL